MGSLDDLALADLLRTDLLPQMAEEVSGSGIGGSEGGGGGCRPGIGTILGWDQQQQVEPVAGAGLQLLRSAECQYQQQQQTVDLLDLNCGGRGEVFSDIEVSEAVDRSLAKLVS